MRTESRKTAVKLAASVLLVGGAASVAGLGTYGSFTSSTSASESVTAGQVKLTNAGGAQGTSIAATGIVPGDTIQRSIVLTRGTGNEKFGSVTLTTTGTESNLLTTDTANGLQVAIDQCPTAWTPKAADSKELVCAGTPTSVVPSSPVVNAGRNLTVATAALNEAASTSNLRVTLTLPTNAGNDFQGLSNTVNFDFLATQRAAESR